MSKICIIGGGISGLSIALEKKLEGHSINLFESSDKVGGVVKTEKKNGFLLDYGPNTLNVRLKKTKYLLQKYDAWDSCLEANPNSNKRMIIRGKKIINLPHNGFTFLTSPFLSVRGKLRLLIEPLLPRSKNTDTETVASFIKRRMGQEVLDYAANPFLAGIYAASPESLILNQAFPAISEMETKYRSIILGLKKSRNRDNNPNLSKSKLVSFKNGMEELAQKLALKLENEIKFETLVKKVESVSNKWRITTQKTNGNYSTLEFDEVYSTIPSHKIDSIEWKNIHQNHRIRDLCCATHHPLALAFLGFNKKDISHPLDGFGFLVPEVEQMKILGTLFSSTLFPGRAPKDQVLLTTFIGGERNPNLAKQKDSEILSIAKEELAKLLGISGHPTLETVKKWSEAIPLPDGKISLCKKAALELSKANKGLHFAGSYLSGVSLPNCLDPLQYKN